MIDTHRYQSAPDLPTVAYKFRRVIAGRSKFSCSPTVVVEGKGDPPTRDEPINARANLLMITF